MSVAERRERAGESTKVVPIRADVTARAQAEAGFRALQAGQRAGLLWLYDQYGRLVHRTVHRLLGPDRDHEDLVQDVFVALLQRASEVRERRALASFVRRVAVSKVVDELRRRQVRRRVVRPLEEDEEILWDGFDPAARDLLRSLFSLLEELPVAERVAFQLRYLEQHRLAEVAELCGCSVATVTRRLRRGRERVKRRAQRDPQLLALVEGL